MKACRGRSDVLVLHLTGTSASLKCGETPLSFSCCHGSDDEHVQQSQSQRDSPGGGSAVEQAGIKPVLPAALELGTLILECRLSMNLGLPQLLYCGFDLSSLGFSNF